MMSENYTSVYDAISTRNPAFCSYLIVLNLLILKMMGLTLLTIFHRMRNKIFISSEDAVWMNGEVKEHDTIERVRRAVRNDLESIPIFIIAAFGYLFTNPPLWVVNVLYIVFLVVRALHSFVYAIYVVPQPTRALLWFVGFAITGYMAIHCAIYALVVGYTG